MQTTLTKLASLAIMEGLCGRFISITFIKKDGTKTKRCGKLAQSPPTHEGNSNLFTLRSPAYSMYENTPAKYASINPHKVTEIKANKKTFSFI